MCMVFETEFLILILFMLTSSGILPYLLASIFMVSRLASLQRQFFFKQQTWITRYESSYDRTYSAHTSSVI